MLQTVSAQTNDKPFLLQLYASSRADEVYAWGWNEEMINAFLEMQWNAQQQYYASRYPEAEHLIIYSHQHRAGNMIISHTPRRLTLVDITLLPEYRNQKIGTQLLQQLQYKASSLSIPFQLSVLKTNPAYHLYQRLGFKCSGGNDLYHFLEWTHQNSLFRGDES